MKTRLLAAALTALGLMGAAPAALACSCMQASSPAAHAANYSVIFRGTIIGAASSVSSSGVGEMSYTVQRTTTYKGFAPSVVTITTAASSAACGVTGLGLGQSVLFFTDSSYRINLCGQMAPAGTEASLSGPPKPPILIHPWRPRPWPPLPDPWPPLPPDPGPRWR